MKICPKCKTNKEDSHYYVSSKGFLNGRCKECDNERRKTPEFKRYQANYTVSTKGKLNGLRYYHRNKRDKVKGKNFKYNDYKANAIRRGKKFELNKEQFISFWQKSCYYCGGGIETIGLDRVDNTLGYTLDNVVPCCSVCNRMKMDLTKEKFIQQCQLILRNLRIKKQ